MDWARGNGVRRALPLPQMAVTRMANNGRTNIDRNFRDTSGPAKCGQAGIENPSSRLAKRTSRPSCQAKRRARSVMVSTGRRRGKDGRHRERQRHPGARGLRSPGGASPGEPKEGDWPLMNRGAARVWDAARKKLIEAHAELLEAIQQFYSEDRSPCRIPSRF